MNDRLYIIINNNLYFEINYDSDELVLLEEMEYIPDIIVKIVPVRST